MDTCKRANELLNENGKEHERVSEREKEKLPIVKCIASESG